MQTNVKAPLFLAKAAMEYLPARESRPSPFQCTRFIFVAGGRIIFISSSLTGSTSVYLVQEDLGLLADVLI